jgi:oligoendopeptidase F
MIKALKRKPATTAPKSRGKSGSKPAHGANGKVKALLPRAKVKPQDTWDLSSLFPDDTAWESAFGDWSGRITGYAQFKGKLAEGAETLAACMQFDADFDRTGERLGTYAFLRTSEDQGNSDAQRMKGRYTHVATQAAEAASYIRPEIMAISPEKIEQFLAAPALAQWKLSLERMLRYRPHTLGPKEENLLAMQGQMSEASNQVFRQLNDADLKWGTIKNERGERVELGHSSFSAFLHSPQRRARKEAFHAYYAQYDAHKNSIAAALNGSVQRDVYYARARNHASAREASLFQDNVPVTVYDNLIEAVHRNLPALYRYYEVRRRKMRLRDIHHYDTYVPILADLEKRHSWDQAVKVVVDSLAPLGDEYCRELQRGMTVGRWCDRYPNQGKQSGAFSSGSFDGQPYILMNYQPQVLDHVFTLTHEAGHSMHSHYSAKSQPYQYYNYTIFVAEVASTFNEQLLAKHLMARAKGPNERAFLLNRMIDNIRGTIIRQTMFAEFEKVIHALVESGEPLTVDRLRGEYRKLLELYFGPAFTIDPELELECLRIPHFYSAFYVYKYATGLSAAIALAERVTKGGRQELDDYLGFLKGGCSRFPLDLLRGAGVDMEKPEPVDTALQLFAEMVDELDELL